MKYLVIPQAYTIIAFGASIFLWSPITQIPLPTGRAIPFYLIHPLFAQELILNVSTAILWIIVLLISFYDMKQAGLSIAKGVAENSFIVALAFITIIVGILGGVIYSETIYIEPYTGWGSPSIQPSHPIERIIRATNAFGLFFCEGAWIIVGLHKVWSHFKKLQ